MHTLGMWQPPLSAIRYQETRRTNTQTKIKTSDSANLDSKTCITLHALKSKQSYAYLHMYIVHLIDSYKTTVIYLNTSFNTQNLLQSIISAIH